MQPAQTGGTGPRLQERSVRAAGAVRVDGAVVVRAKVDGLAAERAALVDEFLEFLDGHVDWLRSGTKTE